jgi:hypothetical protein
VLLCRSLERADTTAQDIRLQTEGEVIVEQLDLGKPKFKKKLFLASAGIFVTLFDFDIV